MSAEFVITDGGSLQEETHYLGIPCLLFREATERVEGLESNVVLSSFNRNLILDFVRNYKDYRKGSCMQSASASEIIVQHVRKYC